MMNCNAPDTPQPASAPLRTRTGARQSKADKKAEKRRRQQMQGLALLALAETRRQVRLLLEDAERYAWTFCHSGRLLLPLNDGSTLHVYSPANAVREASDVSGMSLQVSRYVVNGRIGLVEYEERAGGELVLSQTFVSGQGRVGSPVRSALATLGESVTVPGKAVVSQPGRINRLQPTEGAVVVVRRNEADGFVARTYWPLDGELVPDQMAPATAEQVRAIASAALANWSDQ